MSENAESNFKVIYEWHGRYNCVVIWQLEQRGGIAYTWMIIPTGAEPPEKYPEKACHYLRFMDCWRHAAYAMSHERVGRAA